MKIKDLNLDLVRSSDGKLYQKTRTFGNRNLRVAFKNRKKYSRKDFKSWEE